ncbi:unnamed protein product [Chrysodeixis includens]|uniref:Uncharacterized protein n=1 Tax=Chrysodeixis includens TaxID=689277 RepID=A0A9N8L5X8_CHRIL|nr:unnamed protein product [Chrysodeixis includens]
MPFLRPPSPLSPYKTDLFELECGEAIFPARKPSDPRLSASEYVRIVSDVLCVNKNVCLCRHFHKLDMANVERKSPTLKYIDVWLVEVLSPCREEAFTVRGLFALQLAAVVRSARGWQHLRLRLHAALVPAAHPTTIHGNTAHTHHYVSCSWQHLRLRLHAALVPAAHPTTIHGNTAHTHHYVSCSWQHLRLRLHAALVPAAHPTTIHGNTAHTHPYVSCSWQHLRLRLHAALVPAAHPTTIHGNTAHTHHYVSCSWQHLRLRLHAALVPAAHPTTIHGNTAHTHHYVSCSWQHLRLRLHAALVPAAHPTTIHGNTAHTHHYVSCSWQHLRLRLHAALVPAAHPTTIHGNTAHTHHYVSCSWQHLRLRLHAALVPAAHPTTIHGNTAHTHHYVSCMILTYPSPTEAGRTVAVGEHSALETLAAGRPLEERLDKLLKLLRINATTHIVTEWPKLDDYSRYQNEDDNSMFQRVPVNYLQIVNNIIKQRSSEATAVTFVQLPAPPKLSYSAADEAVCEQYLKVLDEFTKDLPPTILVRGLKSVTSTAL